MPLDRYLVDGDLGNAVNQPVKNLEGLNTLGVVERVVTLVQESRVGYSIRI